MASYIAPEYEEIEESLEPFLKEYDLDPVTVSSLIRGSIEILEEEIPKASIVTVDENDFTVGVSIKPKNIKINFKFAINSIFSFKSVYDSKGVWLVLAILKTIGLLLEEMKIDLNKNDAAVVFCLYRLQEATLKTITDYAEKLKEDGMDIQQKEIEVALKKLEKIGTVKLNNGKYCLCETILVRKRSKKN